MSAVQNRFGAPGSNRRSTTFSATGWSWLESVVQRDFRLVLAATPASLISLAAVFSRRAWPRATNSAWIRGLP